MTGVFVLEIRRVACWLRRIGALFIVLHLSAPLWWWFAIRYVITPPDFSNFLSYRPIAVTEVFSRGPDHLPIHIFYGVEDYTEKIPVFRRIVGYEHIRQELRFAILAIEDHRFCDHNGVDIVAFWGRSLWINIAASATASWQQKALTIKFEEGASTITQQVCRLIYFSGELALEQKGKRTKLQRFHRKLREQSCAVHLEQFLTKKLDSSQRAKEIIFTVFANVAPMGNGRYGFAAAAEYYFKKKLRDIAIDEAAILAGIPKNPERLGIHDLLFRGVISVHTTIDYQAQQILNAVMDQGRRNYLDRHQDHVSLDDAQRFQGAAVVLSNKGEILAVYGVYLATDTSLNRAVPHSVLIRRQPGSAFKPFVYLTALEKGWSLEDRVNDAPLSINMGGGRARKQIHNYDNQSKGWISMRQALAESRNLATVWLAQRLGAKKVVERAIRLGLPRSFEAYPTTAIGAEEVTPLEMARAFAAFANGGDLVLPYLVSYVITYQGDILIAEAPEQVPVLSGMTSEFMAELLRGAVLMPHATARSAQDCPIEFFGKTGTTNNPKKKNLYCEPGWRIALPVFRSFIEQYYRDKPAPRLPSFIEVSVRRAAEIR